MDSKADRKETRQSSQGENAKMPGRPPRSYQSPTLVEFGSVAKLTETTGTMTGDGGGMMT